MELMTLNNRERVPSWLEVASLVLYESTPEEYIKSLKDDLYQMIKQKGKNPREGIPLYFEIAGDIGVTSLLQETNIDDWGAISIFHVAVREDLQGKGIGRHLVHKTLQRAKDKGYVSAHLLTPVEGFYKKCGLVEEPNSDRDLDGILMKGYYAWLA